MDLGIADRVTFFGFRENRLGFLNGFDFFVLPSRLEGIPRCLMEAMTAQKVVVGSDIPGTRELIVDGQTGFLFSSEDTVALAEKLDLLLKKIVDASEVARRGRELVLRNYSAERMANEYEDVFDEVACSEP